MIILLHPNKTSSTIDHILSYISKRDLQKALKQGQIHQEEIHSTYPQKEEQKAVRTAKRLLKGHVATSQGNIITNPYFSLKYGA